MGDLACNIVPVDDITEASDHSDDTSAASDNSDDSSAASDYLGVQYSEAELQAIGISIARNLPEELFEVILSFLPVPDLFRGRSVSKKWNELLHKQSCLDLYDQNGGRLREYLFVTVHLSAGVNDLQGCVHNTHMRSPTCFLDLDERRWYSLPTAASLPVPSILRLLAMDDGLVCELSWTLNGKCRLVMLDPVANRRRVLPTSTPGGTPVCCQYGVELPVIVTHVDNENRSFKVFIMNRNCNYADSLTGFFMYESSTNVWLDLKTPPQNFGSGRIRGRLGEGIEESAVFFRGNLYVVVRTVGYFADAIIVSYDLQNNSWREVLAVGPSVLDPAYPQLIVSGNRMFISIWSIPPQAHGNIHPPFFEIMEILLDKNETKSVVKFTNGEVTRITGENRLHSIQYGFPLTSNSVLLLTRHTGRLLTYDLSNGAGNGVVGALPPHPLLLSHQDDMDLRRRQRIPHYRGRLSKLSLRNIL